MRYDIIACNMFKNRTNMLLETRLRFLMNLEVLSMDAQFGRCPMVSWRMLQDSGEFGDV